MFETRVGEELLRRIQKKLAEKLGSLGVTRQDALARAGIQVSTYDTAWSRGSMKLRWILEILVVNGIDPEGFFHEALCGSSGSDLPDPPICDLVRNRLEVK